jgi:ABC-type transport system involved in multi-copper enzyme maturation permease subunit
MTLTDNAAHPTTPAPHNSKDSTMTTTTTTLTPISQTTDPRTDSIHEADAATHHVTFRRLVSSEWLKFRTVRTNVIALGGAAVAAIGFGALFSSLAGSGSGPDRLSQNALSLSLGGFQLSQIIIAILGVALVAGEYQTGLIRTWFGAAPNRLRVLAAKTTVYGGLVFVVGLVAAILAFLAGQALLPAGWVALSLGSEGVLQALLGTAFYAAVIGVIGVGLGFLLRSTAAGAGAVVTMLMIAPLMVGLLPASISDPIGKILPSNAATAVQGVESSSELLSTGWGVAVLIAWVMAIVGAAAISLKRRDA